MSPRVVNGTASGALDWPAMAALVYSGYTPAKGQFCGGTLIDSRWVLTAAHCVHDLAASGLYVYLGEVDLDSPLGDSINVESILVHPDYNNLTTDFDVALLRLVSDASQTPATVVAQGDPQGLTTVGKTGTVAGWGATSEGGTSSSDLLQANVQIISLVEAEQDYTPLGYVITDNMLPAGVRGGGTDTCQGDSGGPFYVRNAAATGYEIAGVVSFGHGCAQPNLPGIYARLSVFSDWIANATNATLAPSVTITHPVDGATDVPVNTAFFVQFSAAMNSSTINSTTITLADSLNSSVGGSVRYDDHNRMALFQPSSDLSGSSNYTATVSTDVSNLNGVSPASAHDFTFKTAVGSDTTKPLVTSFNPTSAATGVATKTSVSVVFDEYMDPFTVNSSTLGLSGKSVSVAYEALSKTAVIKPTSALSTLTDYTASVSALVKDLCGNAKGSASYSTFTTAASAYNLPTRLSNILPNNGTDNRTVATVVSAAFSTAMDPSSFTQDTFTLENAMGKVSGTVSYDTTNKVAVFTPTSYLDYATIYTATLTSGVQSLSSSSLGYPVVWTFTTGNANGTDANSTTSAQVASSKGSGNIQVSLSTSNARLYGVSAVSDTATGINTSGKPTDYTFTDGLLAYQISVPVTNPGSSATVTLTFPNVVNGTQVYKVDSSGFSQFSGATVSSGNTVTMTVTDGGTGDTDGVINGVINDPVGLASISTGGGGGGGSSSGGGGGGCSLSPGAGFGLEAFLAVFTPLGLLAFRRPRNRRCRRM